MTVTRIVFPDQKVESLRGSVEENKDIGIYQNEGQPLLEIVLCEP